MKNELKMIVAVCVMAGLAFSTTGFAGAAYDLTTERETAPLGLDTAQPRFSWEMKPVAGKVGQKQTAYRILVATSLNKLREDKTDVWDSGKGASGQSLDVKYNGVKLKSRTLYFWKVETWDESGRSSGWSKSAAFSMGILSEDEWQGQWIQSDLTLFEYQKELKKIPDHNMETEAAMWSRANDIRNETAKIKIAPAVWMRKEFKSKDKKLRCAKVFISGLGLYETYLNGRKVNDHLLTVSPHDFSKTVPYHVHDVTAFVKEGENSLGVILGNGYFNPVVPSVLREYAADFINPPRLRCELLLEYEDGSTHRVLSDSSWKFTTAGPIRFNSIRAGETYDARKELGDWSAADFDDKNWKSAKTAKGPKGRLTLRNLPPVRVVNTIPAVSLKTQGNGVRFDIGVESTGWARLKLRGKVGQKVIISYLGKGGHTLGRYQTFEYICKGEGVEIYEPRFAFSGYRYVDVKGLDYTPDVTDLVGCQVVSDLETVGSFSCSDERLNYLQEVNCRTIRNYVIQTPMDPVREKVSWTQDVQSNFETSFYNFNVHGIYDKWQDDFIDSILDSGYVPTVVPSCFDGPTINGPWWGGMMIYNPWQLYNSYGDKEILVRSYDAMKHHMTYYDSIAKGNIVSWGLGDWMDIASNGSGRPQGTTVPYSSTCAYKMYADILAKTALLLGKKADAEYFAGRSDEIRRTIHQKFYNKETGVYDKGSQTACILALKLDIVAKDDRTRIVENLRKQISADKDHLSTGFVGTPFLLTFLNEEGLGDLAWKIATQETYPSWYDMIYNKKNTCFKENWQGGLVQMPSLAGPIGAWFYRSLGGIRPGTPGFKTIIIQPYTKTLDWVKCGYESPYGRIRSDWKKANGVLIMDISIPSNTSATVYVPAKARGDVTESGKSIGDAEGLKFLRMENGSAVFSVDSGHYSFVSKHNK